MTIVSFDISYDLQPMSSPIGSESGGAKRATVLPRARRGGKGRAFDTDEAITFQVVVLSNLFGRPFYESVGRHAKININEWRVMLVLARHPALSQTEIAECTGLHRMTVSRAVRRLVSQDCIFGQKDETDGRRSRLFLTPAGGALCERALPLLGRREAMVGSGLAAAEIKEFRNVLARIIENVRGWPDIV